MAIEEGGASLKWRGDGDFGSHSEWNSFELQVQDPAQRTVNEEKGIEENQSYA